MKTILVCGGRDYGVLRPNKILEHPRKRAERRRLREFMDGLFGQFGPFQIIHGSATGADSLAHDWALTVDGMPRPIEYPALWNDITAPGAVIKTNRAGKQYNVLAGHHRNDRMLRDGKPDLCVAFPGGTGTADMVARARKASVEVIEVSP